MDISGPIRPLLLRHLQTIPAESILLDPLLYFTRLSADPDYPPSSLPRLPAMPVPSSSLPFPALITSLFTSAALLRLIPRIPRGIRVHYQSALRPHLPDIVQSAQKSLVLRSTPPVVLFWHHWLLVLHCKHLAAAVPDVLLQGLWQRGFAGQTAGPLHASAPADAALEIAAFQDFCVLHAAYNAILLTRDYDRFPPLQKAIDWHLANTQPDHITADPWALAAFAGLDPTGIFAQQQLHAAATLLANSPPPPSPLTLALLADALLTVQQAADY